MQIKPIIAAAGAIACMLVGWTAFAANAPNPSGDAMNYDSPMARAGEIFMLQAMTEEAREARPEEQDMTQTGKPAATVLIRTTRPKFDRHKDARACLDAGNNTAIIKCAEKYRYR